MPQAAVPIAAEAAVATTLTAAEIAAAEAAAAAAAEAAAVAATNSSVLSTIAATPVSSAAGATTAAGTGVGAGAGTGVGGIVDLGTSPEVLQQLQSVKGPLDISSAAANTSTGPGSMSNFGELVNPFETLPPAAPPVAGPPAAPVLPAAPPPAMPPAAPPPAMPPPEYGFTGAPPAEPLVESAVTTPVNPSNPVQATSTPLLTSGGFDTAGFEGIDILAKEVGVMPGVQSTISAYGAGAPPGSSVLPSMPVGSPTGPGIDKLVQTNLSGMGSNLAPTLGAQTSAFNTPAATLTQYGAGAPTSTLPTTFNPAAPMANPTYAQSGLQGLQTNLSGSLGSNLPPPSVSQVVTSAGTGAPPETDILKQMINPNGAERFAGTQNLIENPASVPSDMYTKESLRVPLDEQLGRMPTEAIPNTTIPAQAATAAAPEAGGLQGLYNDFKAMSLPNKLLTGMLASSAYQMLNPPKPYEKEKYKPTFKPGLYTGYQPVQPTPYTPQYAHGGLANLGGYSDGGRMLKGPGDGMSDDIPATIANKQPARLANEEFVIPADVVSHLGNGSSEAGAKVLYKMMDRIRKARTGTKKQGKQINPDKYLA